MSGRAHPHQRVVDEVRVDPERARLYAEGWQSWSPATWYPATSTGLGPDLDWQHLMRFRPGTPLARGVVQAEGLLVVDPGTGEPARCFGTTDTAVIPTLTAALERDHVVVRCNGPVRSTRHDAGGEAALEEYGDWFAERAGVVPVASTPTVWCSWYRYFEDVSADDVRENLRALDDRGLSVDVVQVDDGWSLGLGEGLRSSDRFGSLVTLAEDVLGSGRRLGVWLAPFLVGAGTSLAREHPNWLVGPAGRNWGEDLVGLDLTHPGVRETLVEALTSLLALGVDYLKLDFLYAGAVPGDRYGATSPEEAYRSGLQLIRDTVGPDVYLVGCGAPLLPSVGLVDAMRVSPDTFHEGGEDGSSGLRGLMPLAARAWQQGRLWTNDPDCLVARPSYRLREQWASAVTSYGGLASFSDRVAELDDPGLSTVRGLLETGSTAAPFPHDRVRHGAAQAGAELAERRKEPA